MRDTTDAVSDGVALSAISPISCPDCGWTAWGISPRGQVACIVCGLPQGPEQQQKPASTDLQEEVERLRGLLHRDHTGLAAALDRARRILQSYAWLGSDGDWGNRPWPERTVETLREEISRCLDGAIAIVEQALHESGDVAVTAFRPDTVKELKAEVDKLKQELEQARSKRECACPDCGFTAWAKDHDGSRVCLFCRQTRLIDSLAERVAAQSQLLQRRAERGGE